MRHREPAATTTPLQLLFSSTYPPIPPSVHSIVRQFSLGELDTPDIPSAGWLTDTTSG